MVMDRNQDLSIDELSHLASIVAGKEQSSPPSKKRQHGRGRESSGETKQAIFQESGASFPLLQQGGLTEEQLLAIQKSLALPVQDVTEDKNIRGEIPSFGVDIPNQVLTQVDAIQTLSPAELQDIISGVVHIGNAPPDVPEDAVSPYKNWWDEDQEQELVRLVKNEGYRKKVLGSKLLNWKKIANHFGRTESALRKKVWLLTKQPLPKGSPVGKRTKRRWTEDENAEMQKIVTDEQYRISEKIQDGTDGSIKWKVMASKFGSDVAGVQRKYRRLQEKVAVTGSPSVKKHREHHKKSLAYKWMIVAVMKDMPEQEGTALDIFRGIASNEDFYAQLDDTTAPGTARVPRWKIQIRKTLSGESIFVNTGRKVQRETVWKLDTEQVDQIKMRPKQRTGQSVII